MVAVRDHTAGGDSVGPGDAGSQGGVRAETANPDLDAEESRPSEAMAHEPVAREHVADEMRPLIDALFPAGVPVRFEFWDRSALGPDGGPSVSFVRARALSRVLWAPGELGLARAYVSGDVDLDGDVATILRRLKTEARLSLRGSGNGLSFDQIRRAARAARRLGAIGLPPTPPREECRLVGWRHSKMRDSRAVSHHYDVSNEFYALVLGDRMTYSCARWGDNVDTLGAAQDAKHELICRKLGLHRRDAMRLLDIGCGWGSLAIHAARHHGARVVGITISREQYELACERVKTAGVDDLVEIRLQDYRDLTGETFDAVSSVGMFEHVGSQRMAEYFGVVRPLLAPTGRFVNHAISSVGNSRVGPRTFIGRYVFPDAELIDVAQVVDAMQRAGFEVRDVESLREHYARTLRAWVAALEANWDAAVSEVGEARARVWRLYMAASVVGFDDGGISIHQVLGVVPDAQGTSAMPWRRDW